MTKADIIAEVEKRLGPLDEKAKRAVEMAMELMERLPTTKPEPKWQGENPSFDQAAKMLPRERGMLLQALEQQNREWLERKLKELNARWLLVIDGEVVRYGTATTDYLTDEELLALCRERGKLPLLFMPLRPIEETTRWHSTIYDNDAYPTITLRVLSDNATYDLIADFDTGSSEVYLDADTLVRQRIIRVIDADPIYESTHLGRPFEYVIKFVRLALVDVDGKPRETRVLTVCVFDWHQSPFVSINPNRKALVGRDLCLLLQPKITLDFSRHETTIHW